MATMRESSKREWTSSSLRDDINTGSLQRIADATEKMAVSHVELSDNLERYKRLYVSEQETSKRLNRSNVALRGVITKLRRKRGG